MSLDETLNEFEAHREFSAERVGNLQRVMRAIAYRDERFDGDARWPLQGHETECAGCHLATCTTFGIHGDAVWRSGQLDPDPDDPRNRGIETGDARRAWLRERLGA